MEEHPSAPCRREGLHRSQVGGIGQRSDQRKQEQESSA